MKIYLNHIEEIIKNEKLYDKELFAFLVTRITEKECSDYKFILPRINESHISANLSGAIEKRTKHSVEYGLIIKNQIKELNPILLKEPKFYLSENNNEVCVSLGCYTALENVSDYIKIYGDKNLSKEDGEIWLKYFLKEDREKGFLSEKSIEFIFNTIYLNKDYLLLLSKKSKSNLFLTNKSLRDFFGKLTFEQKNKIIDKDQIELIINTYESKLYRKKDFKLSDFLSIADVDKSFNLLNKKERFSLYSFFEQLFNYSSDFKKAELIELINDLRETKIKTSTKIKLVAASHEIKNQLILFKDKLQKQDILEKDLELFYAAVILSFNKGLYLEARKIFDLPSSKKINEMIEFKYSNGTIYKELEVEALKNKLTIDLNSKEIKEQNKIIKI